MDRGMKRVGQWRRCLACGVAWVLCWCVFAESVAQDGPPGCAGVPVEAREEMARAYSRAWTGAFVGAGLAGGVVSSGGGEGAAWGWTVGVQGRANLVLSLVGMQLDYHYGRTMGEQEGGSEGRHRMGAAIEFHPLFLVNLGSEPWWLAVASWYVQVGAGLGWQRAWWGMGWLGGSGFDVPLTAVDGGDSLWLGLHYRLSWWRGGALREHGLSMALSWRHNGLW